MPNYLISGLHVASDAILPGAIPLACPPAPPIDLRIAAGSVANSLARPLTASGPNWEMAGDAVLFRVPGVLRMSIAAGRELIYELLPGIAASDALIFILGTGIGIALLQRGHLVLHASAVSIDRGAVLFCGESGVGKSTLAFALCRAGADFLNDDVCVVDWDGETGPSIRPDARLAKLWQQAIERLGICAGVGQEVRSNFRKFYVELARPRSGEPPPLRALYMLRPAFHRERVEIEAMPIADAAAFVGRHLYRGKLARRMGLEAALFPRIAELVGRIPVYSLYRPSGFQHLPETVAALLAHAPGR